MTRSEAVSKIEKIKSNFEAFTASVNSLISVLNELSTGINGIDYNSILHETTISLINAGLNKINGDITKINSSCKSVVSSAKNDANQKIKEIVDQYNNSIKDDPDATALSYQTVTGEVIMASDIAIDSSTEGTPTTPKEETPKDETQKDETVPKTPRTPSTPTTPGDDTSSETPSETPQDDTSSETPETPSETPQEETPSETPSTVSETLDYYFAHAMEEKLNSSNIEGWDDYIKQFLEENNLSTYVSSITIEDGVIKCTLVNGKTFEYTNVTGIVDLLKKLQTSILKDTGGANA